MMKYVGKYNIVIWIFILAKKLITLQKINENVFERFQYLSGLSSSWEVEGGATIFRQQIPYMVQSNFY